MFPSIFTSFNIVSPTDKLNAPSHSALENTQSSAIGQLQAFIGRSGDASTIGTLLYQIRSSDSDGGGHVQTANKGGTGQTSFNKGDILVAQSSSVISKLAVGSDTFLLQVASTQSVGVQWANPALLPKTKVYVTASVITVVNTVAETSILSANIPGSTLGSNNAIKATLYIRDWQATSGGSVLGRVFYGGGVVSSFLVSTTTPVSSVSGTIECRILADQSSSVQQCITEMNLRSTRALSPNTSPSIVSLSHYERTIASVASDASQTLGITIKSSATNVDLRADGAIIESFI
jgi:hypothetical protein